MDALSVPSLVAVGRIFSEGFQVGLVADLHTSRVGVACVVERRLLVVISEFVVE